MRTTRLTLLISVLLSGDTGGQCPLPKMGRLVRNAKSPMPVRVQVLFFGIGRSLEKMDISAKNLSISQVSTAGDTGVFGKDFGKIFGNVSTLPVAIAVYGNFNANDRGGRRG